jgi:hypothetical protein
VGVRFSSTLGSILAILLAVMACSPSSHEAQTPPAAEPVGRSSHPDVPANKIASPIRDVLQRMRADGLTAVTAEARQAETYSTPLVRIDPTGRVHTTIVVMHLDAQVPAALLAQQVVIEHTDDATQSLQTWIPFERVETVAALPFVRYLRPPRYASRR